MYIKKKHRELLAKADKEFTIPTLFQKFIEKNKLTHNLIIKSKGNNCQCTCCNNRFISKVKVNQILKCPYCKQKLLVKTNRLQEYVFKDNLQLLDKIDNTLVLRTFELYSYYKNGKIENYCTEFMRSIIEENKVSDFVSNNVSNHMGYMYVNHYLKITKWRLRNYRWSYRDVLGLVSSCNIKSLLKNTSLKYSEIDKYVSHINYYIDFIRCLRLASYPSFEMLVKLKLYALVDDADKFTSGKNFQEIFGIPKTFYKFMRKQNINYNQLSVLRLLKKEDIKLINKLVNYHNLEELANYVNLEDAYYKILKNNNNLAEYLDYLRMCKQLQYSLKDKKILFPKNLKAEHDKLVDLIEMIEDEANDKLIKKRLTELNKNCFQDKRYMVYPAPSVESMKLEANSQKNCLLSYCDRYSLGKTDIYYVRELKNKNKSLITVEVRNNKIVQARIKYNDLPTKEQQHFLDKWENKILSKKLA